MTLGILEKDGSAKGRAAGSLPKTLKENQETKATVRPNHSHAHRSSIHPPFVRSFVRSFARSPTSRPGRQAYTRPDADAGAHSANTAETSRGLFLSSLPSSHDRPASTAAAAAGGGWCIAAAGRAKTATRTHAHTHTCTRVSAEEGEGSVGCGMWNVEENGTRREASAVFHCSACLTFFLLERYHTQHDG
jgi:hypothetical protein